MPCAHNSCWATMAPVKISHVISFSSQDRKYPVENLLNPDSQRGPWLSCPQDKSGQLKVELQLERAVPIGYIDVGNCGCAFLQIDVGRSSWSLDRPFVTLLPATMLMSLADSKQGTNRSGVRMFKDGKAEAEMGETESDCKRNAVLQRAVRAIRCIWWEGALQGHSYIFWGGRVVNK